MPPLPAWLRRWGAGALLFVLAALLSGVTMLDGIQPNDEGLMLQAAVRIAGGEVPYGDFWWFYPPGQPYLLGALTEVFGPSLLTWRVVRVLLDATVALLAWRLALRAGTPRLALAAWLGAALAMAYPSGPHPFPGALALALGALLLARRSPVAAGALAGACAGWRIEFAAYLGLGVLLGYALGPGGRGPALRAAGRFAAAAAAVAVLLLGPVVVAAGLRPSWDLLVVYPVRDFGDYQSLPFPVVYDGPLNLASPGGFLSDTVESLLAFYLPLALLLGFAGALVALAATWRPGRGEWVAVAVFSAGMAHYLVVRPDVFHTAPLAVMVAVLAAWARGAARAPSHAPRRRVGRAGALVALAALAFLVVEGLDRRWLEIRDEHRPLRLERADGVRAQPAVAAPLEDAVRDVQRRVPPGRPIYVMGSRADITTSGHPLFYVLAGRPNATPYDIPAPGVVTSAPVQREIVGHLERTRTAVVVRWRDPVTAAPEPNRAGRSSGVRILDEHVARRYRRVARFGDYDILERVGG